MSIFNSFAALAGGLEYEEGTLTVYDSTSIRIDFSGTHTKAPVFVCAVAEASNTNLQNYTTATWYINYRDLVGTPRQYYTYSTSYLYAAERFAIRATSISRQNSYNVSQVDTTTYEVANIVSNTRMMFVPYNSSYPFITGSGTGYPYHWIAIWK